MALPVPWRDPGPVRGEQDFVYAVDRPPARTGASGTPGTGIAALRTAAALSGAVSPLFCLEREADGACLEARLADLDRDE